MAEMQGYKPGGSLEVSLLRFFVIVSFLICGVANRKGDDSLTA